MGYLALTVICYKDSGGGTISKAGDQYQIHKVLIALDQPGRAKGDLFTGTTPINSTTGIDRWPHQPLQPTYCWNDKVHSHQRVCVRGEWLWQDITSTGRVEIITIIAPCLATRLTSTRIRQNLKAEVGSRDEF
jgi:hypothetical protein